MLGDATTGVDTANKVTEGFGTLKAVLGTIPAVYANFQVRSRPFVQSSFLTNAYAGNYLGRE